MTRIPLLAAATAALSLAAAAPASAAPANDNFASAIAISGAAKPAPVDFDNTAATKQTGEPLTGPGRTVWFKWTPTASGAAYVDTCGPFDQEVNAFKVKAGAQPAVANLEPARAGDTGDVPLPDSTFCRDRFRAKAGTTYYIQIDGQAGKYNLLVDQDTQAPVMPSFDPAWPGTTGPAFVPKLTHAEFPLVSYFCALDSPTFTPCTKDHALNAMASGQRTFRARARDGHGNLSPVRTRIWTVDAQAPETTITSPAGATPVTFASSEPGTTECSLDGGAFAPCTSPYQPPHLPAGEHRVRVRAIDIVGNADASPAEAAWTVAAPDQPPVGPGGPVVPADGGDRPGVTPPPPAACTLTLSAPRRTTRAALRKGVAVKVTAAGAPCDAAVRLEQKGRRLAGRKVAVTPGAAVKVVLRTRAARRGTVTVVVGALRRAVRVG